MKWIAVPLVASVLAAQALVAQAEKIENRTDFAILLAGLPIAKAQFVTTLDDNLYEIQAEIRSLGIARAISEMTVELLSSGAVIAGELKPDRYFFKYRYGKRNRLFETEFRDGDVVASRSEPERDRSKQADWIAVSKEDLKAVTDPVAGLMVQSSGDPCKSSIAVFDGETRLDLLLSNKGEKAFKTEGFDGNAVVCGVRYQPKSGYRKKHSDMEYIRKLKSMEIWFAKSERMQVYAPVFFSVPIRLGTLTMRATRFGG